MFHYTSLDVILTFEKYANDAITIPDPEKDGDAAGGWNAAPPEPPNGGCPNPVVHGHARPCRGSRHQAMGHMATLVNKIN